VGDTQAFLDHHWAQSPLHVEGADQAAFADLLSLDDVDRLVSSSFARSPTFRLVRDGKPVDPARYSRSARVGGRDVPGVGDPRLVLQEFAAGATIVLQGLQRSWPPLAAFCRSLEHELTFPVQVNAYVTPAGSRGLDVHYDTHDVFVLQLAGTKSWSVHPPVWPDPLPSQPWSTRRQAAGPAIAAPHVAAGDCLYVPRGFLHSATAQEGVSAHLTVGVHAQTWHDVVHAALAATADEPELRRSLPPGWAHDERALAAGAGEALDAVAKSLASFDTDAVAARTVQRFWAGRPPVLTGQLAQVLALDGLDDTTRLRPRPTAVCHLSTGPEKVEMRVGQRTLRMPAALSPVLARVTAGDTFALGDLADMVDEASRRVLVRRLVLEGVLEIVPGGG
jgi:bifunctional lysine-specific demethylase and histidyl-hydroxylase NO66